MVRALLVAGVLALPALAQAGEVWASAEGDRALEVRAFYKSNASALRLPSGLVEVTEALNELGPGGAHLPTYGVTSAHAIRLSSRLFWGSHLDLQAAWELGASAASHPALAVGYVLGGIPLDSLEGARRRLVDFDPVLLNEDGVLVVHNLDLFALRFRSNRGDLTVGRQVFSWGSGQLWNPTDLLSPFAPTDIDREVRRGVDAVRASIPLALTSQLDVLWLPQREIRDHGGVLRTRFSIGTWEVSPSAAKYVRDLVFGMDVGGDVGSLGAHVEAAWSHNLDVEDESFLRAVAGLIARPSESLLVTTEYHYNGWGETAPEDYMAVLQSPRVTRGEVFGAGRHYLGMAVAWQATGLFGLNGIAIANLGDPSIQLIPALEYQAQQNVLARISGVLPIGRGPDSGGIRRLSREDAEQQTDAWIRETSSLGLRSEYGASPLGVFVQIALYHL